MGAASRTKRDATRQQKIAAQRAATRRAQVRRRILLAGGSIITVVAVVVTLVLVKAGSGPGTASAASPGPTGAALSGLVSDVTSVPASVLDTVGKGGLAGDGLTPVGAGAHVRRQAGTAVRRGQLLPVLRGRALADDHRPRPLRHVLWLTATRSSTTDVYPGTATFTFYGSSYRSKYLSFVPVEETTNYRQGNSASPDAPYVTLQTPTAAEQALLDTYDPGSGGNSIPFIDIGNKYVEIANLAPYGPQDLSGKSWGQIAAALRDPSSAIAQGVDASANYLTAGICKLTGNQPATACTPAVRAIERQL